MIATVTATPYKLLNQNERKILDELREGSKTTFDLVEAVGRNYHPVSRSLKNLEAKGWIEEDATYSGGKSKYYCLRQSPTEGVELIIKTKLDQKAVSFNRYFEAVANRLNNGTQPALIDEVENYYAALAYLAALAAKEYLEEGSVPEANLLEVRSKVQNYVEELKNAYALGVQLLDNERLWNAKSLADGILRKTDRYIPPNQIMAYSKMILDSFKKDSTSTEVKSAEETEEEFSNDE